MNYLKNYKALIAMVACASLVVMSCSDEIDEIPSDEIASENLIEAPKLIEADYGAPTTYFYNGREYNSSEWTAYEQSAQAENKALFQVVLGDKSLVYDTSAEVDATVRKMDEKLKELESPTNSSESCQPITWNPYQVSQNLYYNITVGTTFCYNNPRLFATGVLYFYKERNKDTTGGYILYYYTTLIDDNDTFTYIFRYDFPTAMREEVSSVYYTYYQAARTSSFGSVYPLTVRMHEDPDNRGRRYSTILHDEGDTFTQNNLSQNGWFGQNWEDRAQSMEFCIGCTAGNPDF